MSPTRDAQPAGDSKSNLGRRRRAAQTDGSDDYAARKQELLQIAARIFRTKGYERTTITDIAEAAGTDRASLYYYIASKEQLFIELMSQIGVNPAERSQIIAAEDRPAPDRLRALMVALMTSFHEQYPLLYLDLQGSFGAISADGKTDTLDRLITAGNQHFAAFRKVMRDGIEGGIFKSTLPPGLAAEAAIGMVCWSYRWFDPEQSRYSGSEIGEAFADFILNGLVVDDPPTRRRRSRQGGTVVTESSSGTARSREAS
jgi:AcrR family transcriptional regulator